MKKRLISLVLSLAVLFSILTVSNLSTFAATTYNSTPEPGHIRIRINVIDADTGEMVPDIDIGFNRRGNVPGTGGNQIMLLHTDANGVAYGDFGYSVKYNVNWVDNQVVSTVVFLNCVENKDNIIYCSNGTYAEDAGIRFDLGPVNCNYTQNIGTGKIRKVVSSAYAGAVSLSAGTNLPYDDFRFHAVALNGAYVEMNLYVKAISNEVTMRYETDTVSNASAFPTQTVTKGQCFTENTTVPVNKDDPSRPFVGWIDKSTEAAYNYSQAATRNVILTPVWAITQTLTYDTSTVSNASDFPQQSVLTGSYFTENTTKPVNKKDSSIRFWGWVDSATGLAYDFSKPVDGNVTLKPNWETTAELHIHSYLWNHDAYNGTYGSGRTSTIVPNLSYTLYYYDQATAGQGGVAYVLGTVTVDDNGDGVYYLTSENLAAMQSFYDEIMVLHDGKTHHVTIDIGPVESDVLTFQGRPTSFAWDWVEWIDAYNHGRGVSGVRVMKVWNGTSYEQAKNGETYLTPSVTNSEEGYTVQYSTNDNHTVWVTPSMLENGFNILWDCYVAPSMVVEFELNGGNGTQPAIQRYKPINSLPEQREAFKVDRSKVQDPTHPDDDYEFIGWYKVLPDNTTEAVAWDFENRVVGESMTLRAMYAKKTQIYHVSFVNGSEVQSADYTIGGTPSWSGPTPTQSSTYMYDYSFDYWEETTGASVGSHYTMDGVYDLDHQSRTITDSSSNVVTVDESFASTTVYTARFKETLRKFTVTWKNWDGTLLETDLNVAYGTTPSFDQSNPTRPQDNLYTYTFTGWTPAISTVTGDVTYTATYSDCPRSYTITYDANGGTLSAASPQNYSTNSGLSLQAAPSRDGWVFTGWKVNTVAGNWSTGSYSASQSIASGKYGNVTMVAQWKQEFKYKLSFDANTTDSVTGMPSGLSETGWISDSTKTHSWNSEPTREGYSFIGWSTSASGATAVSSGTKTYTLTGIPQSLKDVTLYAQWSLQSYDATAAKATGDAGVDTTSGSGNYNYLADVSFSATLKKGYDFLGWYNGDTSAAAKLGDSLSYSFKMPAKNVTYYAKTQEQTVTYSYSAVSISALPAGTSVTQPSVTTETVGKVTGTPGSTAADQLPLLKFKGWYDNANGTGTPITTSLAYTPSNRDSDNLLLGGTFYAVYELNATGYTVKHWFEHIEDSDYEEDTDLRESLSGNIGESTAAVAKTSGIEGFIAQSFNQETIAASGTVVNIYYNRATAKLKYIVEGADPANSKDQETTLKYGAAINFTYAPEQTNYDLDGWYNEPGYATKVTSPATMGLTDITVYGRFVRQTASLKITKTGMQAGEQAIFTVSGEGIADGIRVVVEGNGGSATVSGLYVGSEYTVTEDTGWSYRYTAADDEKSFTPSSKNEVGELEFANETKSVFWLGRETRRVNVFDKILKEGA